MCLSRADVERQRARLFDREAERYDRSRPGYPAELIDAILGPSPQRLSVLDVACGTGIASRLMLQRGAQVLGVELNPGMADVARRTGVTVELGAFETWDAAGRSFDRVTCGQGWHWLDPVASSGKAASLLRPGGRLCIFWSIGRHPDQLSSSLRSVYQRVLPARFEPPVIGYGSSSADGPTPGVDVVVERLATCPQLAAPQTMQFHWTRSYTRDQWLDQLGSHSDHIALPPELRQPVFDGIAAAIDGFGGRFDMAYTTLLVSATRR